MDDLAIAELLERYMDESGLPEQWVTVYDLRTRFRLDEDSAPVITGFFKRLHFATRPFCKYRVEKIERVRVNVPQVRMIKRYLIRQRTDMKKTGISVRKRTR